MRSEMEKERVPKGKYFRAVAAFITVVTLGGCDVVSRVIDPVPRVVDPDTGETWRMIEEDAKAVGPSKGEFGGWVEGTGYLSDEEIAVGVRLGAWADVGGYGVVRFMPLEEED